MSSLSHFNEKGEARMVDVSHKQVTARQAKAEGYITMPADLMEKLATSKKGNAFEVARLAGILAAKKTGSLIPLCHNIPLDKVTLEFQSQAEEGKVRAEAEVSCHGRTGVEMEALTAVSVALLTLYDMGKAMARDMEIGDIRLVEKSGGRSGDWHRQEEAPESSTAGIKVAPLRNVRSSSRG